MAGLPGKGDILGGKYRVLREIGRGAFAVVFLAEHAHLGGEPVALKVLRPEYSGDREFLSRFRLEAQIAMRLRHPNIIAVRDFEIASEGQVYYAMDHSSGVTLKKLIDCSGPLHPLRALRIIRQMLDALGAAHAQGVVHRDVKPANAMVEVGRAGEVVRLLDFGLAKLLYEQAQHRTASGVVVGTPRYMAPEQARGERVTHRSDLYSTGVVLFEMLAGRLPFVASTPDPHEYLALHIGAVVPRIGDVAPDASVPEPVETIVRKALEKLPDARFQTAAEFSASVDALLRDLLMEAPRVRPVAPTVAVSAALDAERARPGGVAGPQATSRVRLQFRYSVAGEDRVLYVHVGDSARFGRQRRPQEDQTWEDVPAFVLRYLPLDDPRMRVLTDETVSRVHFEARLAKGGSVITDLSRPGTTMGSSRLPRGAATAWYPQDRLILGPGPLSLAVSVFRSPQGAGLAAARFVRAGNGPAHAYLILREPVVVGSGEDAAVRLDASLDVRAAHVLLVPRPEGGLALAPVGDAPVVIGEVVVPPGLSVPLQAGFTARMGAASLSLAAYLPESDAALR